VKARLQSQKLADRWMRLREPNPVAAQPVPVLSSANRDPKLA
jgi:hypothetical protein